ncbi:MAG: FtsX-like permease family protein [Acetobacteraceae bacterium]|nr:FtsX-like permease family protein [Acetobacteraceae bacterium]
MFRSSSALLCSVVLSALYFQTPGLRAVFALLKLQPGGGTSTPIAVPVAALGTAASKPTPLRQIIGLGKLIPLGDVTTVSPPFGANDARIATIKVAEGEAVDGTFVIGGGMTTDGYLIVSDQTFLKLFPRRVAGEPNHILLRLEPGADREAVTAELRERIPQYDTVARSLETAMAKDTAFQTTQKPVGVIFGFGAIIGIMVGCIIVYQVLSTDVADHLREYATFKAIGYPQSFFLGIVFEEAFILAVFGFVPAVIITTGLYAIIAAATGLPLNMTVARAIGVLLGTIAMCALSGAVATRRLAKANPADLF